MVDFPIIYQSLSLCGIRADAAERKVAGIELRK